MMGIWSSTLFGSGGAIQWQRLQGTLELLVAAPAPFLLSLLPITLATASVGLYSIVATLFWGWLLFGMPLTLVHPLAFALAPAGGGRRRSACWDCARVDVRALPHANAFSNLLEYPVWLVTGLLVPVSLLPGLWHPISWVLSPTWGAARSAARRSAATAVAGRSRMCVLPRRRLPRDRRADAPQLRAPRPPAGDAVADMNALRRLLRRRRDLLPRALQLDLAGRCTSRRCSGSPLFQILFFAYLGTTYTTLPERSSSSSATLSRPARCPRIYGSDADHRQRAAVRHALSAARDAGEPRGAVLRAQPPADRRTAWSSRCSASWSARLLLDFHPRRRRLPALALVLVVTVSSCTAFGMMLGSFGLRARDVFFFSNLVYFLMLLFCGVNVPPEELPGWMQAIGNALPLTHGIEAAREVVAGRSLASVGHLVGAEPLVGPIWALVAVALFRIFEAESHRRASLETA